MSPQFIGTLGRKVCGRYIQNRPAAGLSFPGKPVGSPGVGNQNAGSELRIGIQLEAELYDVVMLLTFSGFAGADNKSTMGKAAVITLEFFLADEVYGGIVIAEVVGHGLDFILNLCGIGAIFKDYEAFAGVLLAGGKLGIGSASDSFQGSIYGNRVLFGVLYAGNPANRVGMALTDALAPESIVFPVRQYGAAIDSCQ